MTTTDHQTQSLRPRGAGHTPGPWKINGLESGFVEVGPLGAHRVAVLSKHGLPYSERKANARLIAAAPDLLAALEELVAEFEEMEKDTQFGINETGGMIQARAAIAKATGE